MNWQKMLNFEPDSGIPFNCLLFYKLNPQLLFCYMISLNFCNAEPVVWICCLQLRGSYDAKTYPVWWTVSTVGHC